jgi:esterase/lipase
MPTFMVRVIAVWSLRMAVASQRRAGSRKRNCYQEQVFESWHLIFAGSAGRMGRAIQTCSPPPCTLTCWQLRYLRNNGAKTVAVIGGSLGGGAAADASIASRPGEINRLILLAAEPNGPAEQIKAPLLEIVARDDANDEGLRLPRIRAWFDRAPEPKQLIVLDGSAHAQFLFQTEQADGVMKEILRFLTAKETTPGR